MQSYLVYKTTHVPSGRFYIGRHVTDDLDDGYLGSGTYIRRLIKKHGVAQFRREIIKLCETIEEMVILEIEEIKKVINTPFCVNLMVGDPALTGGVLFSEAAKKTRTHNTPETRAKISAYHSNRPQSVRDKIGLGHKGKTISAEMRAKQSASLSGDKNPRALSWIVEYEDGRPSEQIKSLKSWCRERDIKYTTLYMKLKRNDASFHNGMRVILAE